MGGLPPLPGSWRSERWYSPALRVLPRIRLETTEPSRSTASTFDQYPNNEPHVGCIFEVDFYGFDEGDLNAKVRFLVWPPTGDRMELLRDTVFIGEDSNDGGGSLAGLDAEREYNLSPYLRSYMAHPQQGYHVKLVVNAEGSIGADKKHKVFWIEECAYGS